jgi:hypothetical protein
MGTPYNISPETLPRNATPKRYPETLPQKSNFPKPVPQGFRYKPSQQKNKPQDNVRKNLDERVL